MKTTDERLKEIRDEFDKRIDDRDTYEWDMFVSDALPELIAAVEQSQAELAEAKAIQVNLVFDWGEAQGDITDLRKQLAEARAKIEQLELTEQGAFDR